MPNNLNKSVKLKHFEITFFNEAKKKRNNLLQTSPNSWEYSIEYKINSSEVKDRKYDWIEFEIYLTQGTISLGVYKNNKMYQEVIVKDKYKKLKIQFKIIGKKSNIMFRNADFHKFSVFKVNQVRLIA